MRSGDLTEALETLGALLLERGLRFEIVVALVEDGGWKSALPLPEQLLGAAREVAAALDLTDDWLNPGPTSLLALGLPPGFAARADVQSYGGLTLHVAAREDQVAFKLYAAADQWPHRGKHLQDLVGLGPTRTELRESAAWSRTHDPSPGFREELLVPVLATFGVEIDDVG